MKKQTTKRALFLSALSLLLCASMLIGSTFAWFTDSVTSANNIIKSGNLDIELEYAVLNDDGTFKEWKNVNSQSDILTNTLWEPGATEVAYLRVKNAGSLALKYQLGVNIRSEIEGVSAAGDTFKLSDYIQFGVVEGINGETGAYATREDAVADVTDAKNISAGYTKAESMLAGDKLYLALVVYMPTTTDNRANHNGKDVPKIELGISVVATQYTFEEDSFNANYDKDAQYPVVDAVTKPVNTEIIIGEGDVKIAIPAGAPAGEYTLTVSNENVDTNAAGETTVSLDISLEKDGVKISDPAGVYYEINVEIGKNLEVSAVTHKGVNVSGYSYEPNTGIVTFKADSFSPFAIVYKTLVAKIGTTNYYTIDDAIADWTNGATLTLLNNVTLSDVIKLNSNEYHILDLGTYTMTAAKGKDAIQIVNCARTSASYTLDIKADAENPGGIVATSKAVVKTTGKSGVKDRPIIRFYNGKFTASNIVSHSGSNGTNCPQFQFHGGVYDCNISTNRALMQFYGGTFNGRFFASVDSSAYTLIAGGRFKYLDNLYGSALNSDKFTIGTSKGSFNVGVYVDKEGYIVVGGSVITEPSAQYAAVASASSVSKAGSYLPYSSAATYGLYYEDADMAIAKHGEANVTVYAG